MPDPSPVFHSPHGLFPCQQDGVAFAYTQGSGLLVADTGIGKSVITLALSVLLAEDQQVDLVLLVCKQNKISEWIEDLGWFTNLTHHSHHGASRMRKLERLGLPQVLVSTYETLRTDLAKFAVPPGKRAKVPHEGPLLTELLAAQASGRRVMVVYDEISDRLRNRSSQTYKAHAYALKRLRVLQPELRALGLTATPLAKSYEDGFNQLRLLLGDVMPKIGDFERSVILSRDDYGRPRYLDAGVDEFIALTRPYLWRKRKTDADVRAMFPRRIEEFVPLAMPDAQRELYDAVAAAQEGQEEPLPGLHTALRQIAAYPASLIHSALHGSSQLARSIVATTGEEFLRTLPSAKADHLVEYLTTIVHGQGDKAVVFSQFGPSVLPLLKEVLRVAGVISYLYYGEMTRAERDAARTAFRSSPDPCVLLSSDAGKDGINLPEATYVIEYESALTYETRTQRFGRIDRINSQAPSITCTTLVLKDTVEESVVRSMLKRNEMADRFLGDAGADGHFSASQRRRALLMA